MKLERKLVSNIFVISDTHFGHENIIGYSQRPFSSVFEMDETMVQNWNAVVRPQDKVYHLGDVYFPTTTNKKRMEDLFTRLNGTKVLILGNHDAGKDQLLLRTFKRVYSSRFLKEFGVLLSHIPIHETSINRGCVINVHGHTHTRGSPPGSYKSVCVELTNYYPINIKEINSA